MVGALTAHKSKLAHYIELRVSVDQYILAGRLSEAIALVDNINSEVCWSLEMLSLRIALTSLTEGLESQKQWIAAQDLSRTSIAARFFCYWFGVRSEGNQNPNRYRSEMKGQISQFWADDFGKKFLSYQLVGTTIPDGEEAQILAQCNVHSIIDQYECCVHISKLAAAERRESSTAFYHLFLPLMVSLNDTRVAKISYMFGHLDAANLFNARSYAWDLHAITGGPSPTENLESLDSACLIAKLGISGDQESTSLSSTIISTVNGLQAAGTTYEEAKNALARNGLLFPRFTLGYWSQIQFELSNIRPFESELVLQRHLFMATETHEPSALRCLPEPVREHYLNFLTSVNFVTSVLVDFFDNNPQQVTRDFLSPRAATFLETSEAIESSDFERLYNSSSIARCQDGQITKLNVVSEIVALIKLGRVHEAVDATAEIYRQNQDTLTWLPLNLLAEVLEDRVIGRYVGSTNMALVVWLLAENFDRDFKSPLSYAVERYLEQQGVSRPSELSPDRITDVDDLIFFLRFLCSEETLSLSLNYEDKTQLDTERLKLLSLLKEINPVNAGEYDDEITLILRNQAVVRAVESLQRSKISMDEEPLKDWATKNLRDKFERFRALVDAGIIPASVDFANEMLDKISSGTNEGKPFEIPKNEASTVFVEILNELCRESSLNARHGINSYLSLRIRHGTISGQLRRPSQEQHLLTTVETSSRAYTSNVHWYEALQPYIGGEHAEAAARILSEFSEEYDAIIEHFTSEYVQIRRPEKPKGLIDYRFQIPVVIGFSSDSVETTDFNEFLNEFFSLFWLHIGSVLKGVRLYIDTELRSSFDALFENTMGKLASLKATANVPMLHDALVRARSGLNEAMNEMAAWFDVPQTIENTPLAIMDLVEIGKEMVGRLHPGFTPRVQVTGSVELKLSNALIVFTDALFILFGNVQKHAGLDSPAVDISVSEVEEGVLDLTFTSECDDIESHRAAIAASKYKLSSADYSGYLSIEGGTGLPKLTKVMSHSHAETPLDFGIDEATGRFYSKLRFSFRLMKPPAEEVQYAHLGG